MFCSQVGLWSEQSKIQQSTTSKSSSLLEHAQDLLGQVCQQLLILQLNPISTLHRVSTMCCMGIAGDYKPGDVLGGRYTVVETLGRGSSGITYKVLFGMALDA